MQIRERMAERFGGDWRSRIAGAVLVGNRREEYPPGSVEARLYRQYGADIVSAAASEMAASRKTNRGGRPAVETHCPRCGLIGTAAEILAHSCGLPVRAGERAPGGRPRVTRVCEHCGAAVSGREYLLHRGGRCLKGK